MPIFPLSCQVLWRLGSPNDVRKTIPARPDRVGSELDCPACHNEIVLCWTVQRMFEITDVGCSQKILLCDEPLLPLLGGLPQCPPIGNGCLCIGETFANGGESLSHLGGKKMKCVSAGGSGE